MDVLAEQLGPPVDLRLLFAPQRRSLLALLRSLGVDEWRAPTACEGWTVADVAAHVLGDVLGRLAGARDGWRADRPGPGERLEAFIDRVNGAWVVGARRLSPVLLIDLLERYGDEHDRWWLDQPLDAPSLGVSWAGMDVSPVWFGAARDVTEYWVHERQLRDAVGAPAAIVPAVGVVLDVFARGLPFALGRVGLLEPASLRVVATPSGRAWTLRRLDARWSLVEDDLETPAEHTVTFDDELLWRRWTRQPRSEASAGATAEPFAHAVLDHVAIVHADPG